MGGMVMLCVVMLAAALTLLVLFAGGIFRTLLPAAFRRPETVAGADWFGEEVRRQMVERFGADKTTQGGLAIRTSLNPAMQNAADAALRKGLMA